MFLHMSTRGRSPCSGCWASPSIPVANSSVPLVSQGLVVNCLASPKWHNAHLIHQLLCKISNVFKQVGDQASPELPASCIKNKITWHCGNLKNNYEINNNHTHIHTITSSTTIVSSARLDLMLATSATARVKESKRQSTKKMLAWKKIKRLCKALKYNYQVSNNETANYEATTQKTQRRLRSYLNLAKTENNNKHSESNKMTHFWHRATLAQPKHEATFTKSGPDKSKIWIPTSTICF